MTFINFFAKTSLLIGLLNGYAYSATCPTAVEFQLGLFNHWQAFNGDSGAPAKKDELEKVKVDVAQLALAEWSASALEGSAHCYYLGKNIEDYLSVYLAQANLTPDLEHSHWITVATSTKQCYPENAVCLFLSENY
jgi:hypothetical protein